MLATSVGERTRLLVSTQAEVRTRSPEDAVERVQASIHLYLEEKIPNLPGTLFSESSYDHDSGLLSTEYIDAGKFQMWSSRLSEPDTTVAGRSWSVELTIGKYSGAVFFGSRLSCFSRHLDFDFDPAVPRVYRDLVSQSILFGDGIRLSRSHIDITSDDDVSWLVALIENKKRNRNIIALSCDEYGTCSVNPYIFSDRLCGVAHVVRIFPRASFALSDTVGKYLSVFDSGIRIYRPTQDFDADDPIKHTLFTRHRLASTDIERVKNSIALDSFRSSVDGAIQTEVLPTFVRIRSANATFRLGKIQAAAGAPDIANLEKQLQASQEARMAAEAQAREALDLAVQEETVRKTIEEELNQERARGMVLATRIRLLETLASGASSENGNRPANYEDVSAWVEKEFAGRMKLHSRALRGLKESVFEDVDLVCDMLELLALSYVDGRRGVKEAWKKFEEEIKSRGVDYSKSISGSRAGEEGEQYFVRYRGEREFLEWHLKKGNSRDSRRDLRIYFLWDEIDEEVVVGYLTGHLDTRLT